MTDLQPLFHDRYRAKQLRFDFLPIDEHWNAEGHAVAADAVRHSATYSRLFGGLPQQGP